MKPPLTLVEEIETSVVSREKTAPHFQTLLALGVK
jgi:hypothetical protein